MGISAGDRLAPQAPGSLSAGAWRLRDENAALAQHIEVLQQRASGSVEGTPVVFTEDPAQLRAKVESFIETIDQYLAHAAEPDPEVPS